MSSPSVFVAGPASWNTIILLDRLPEPVPHMQFAEQAWETVGGTSAGKALALTGLGRSTLLYAQAADDEHGRRIRETLHAAGVAVRWAEGATERHVNLMTREGGRVSLYLATPQAATGEQDDALRSAMAEADAVVLDLAAEPLRLLPLARSTGKPIWVDVHDYDGEAEFHRPFLAAADAVFCNADRLDDPLAFLHACITNGAHLAVCTLGADGAVAVDADGTEHRVAAVPVEVVDTNGAGDAFLAGVLDARLSGADVDAALVAGARSAASVLGTRHLHPSLDLVLSTSV
ncbi:MULTISPECIES: carbohydrate kinase family protein [unclassified Microbacterium]|uniref:carbohydrate kinase family protein n=1 Tax=unclassified Microbacterium TaxID=2609290 RepID=UPI000EAAA311|nr:MULTISPECIES: carbohydrate kinase family protein [unclassified Microbacterium]MBT2486787.1 carbohydrate kinase family protein [Microbacterium sp. ISL-108]RKN64714.1 carbohydrate kinase family protein [Microbacterium sp. CGR2]